MTDHDPMCLLADPSHFAPVDMTGEPFGCQCVLIAKVRADERQHMLGRVWTLRAERANAHAEAVAAKLVEVICEDAETIDGLRGALWDLAHVRGAVDEIVREEVARLRVESMDALTAERDAARAEVEAWKRIAQVTQNDLDELASTAVRWYDDLQEARAEVAALREQYVVEEFIDTDGYPSIRVIKAAERVGENEWAAYIRREVLADLRTKVEALRDSHVCDLGVRHCHEGPAFAAVLDMIYKEAEHE